MGQQENDGMDWEEVEVDLAAELPVGDDEGLSLDELDAEGDVGEAEPYSDGEAEAAGLSRSTGVQVPGGLDSDADERVVISPTTILESMLFVGTPDNRPLMADEIAALMRGVRSDEIDDLVTELNERYEDEGRVFEIVSLKGGYRMQLKDQFASIRSRFYGRVKEIRLSQPAVDVLAIVAYRQPISREEVEQLRGRSCGSLLNQLVRRQLVRVEVGSEKPRRKIYHTTDRFLQMFGIRDVSELPQSMDE